METLSILRPFPPLHYASFTPPTPPRLHLSLIALVSRRSQFDPMLRLNFPSRIASRSAIRSQIGAAAATATADSAYPISEFPLRPRMRGVCFYSVTAVVAVVLFVAMVAAHPLVMLLDRHRRRAHHFIAGLWAGLTIAPFYKVEIEGLENLPVRDAAAVYVSNHQSFLDIYTLLTLGRSFKFISKTSVFMIPIVGWAMFMMGLIPLRRMDNRSQLECLKRCMDLVKKGASVFFFPEGTRSRDGKLGAFKKGAFTVAAKTESPVVPITLMGTGKIMPPGKEGIVDQGSVKVVIHKPIGGTNADRMCDEARSVIANTLLLHGYGVHSL